MSQCTPTPRQFEPLPSPQVVLSAEMSVVLLSDDSPNMVANLTTIKAIVDSGSDMRTLDSTDGRTSER